MLGYPTQFGALETIALCAQPQFTAKRIGYLGLMLLLDEDTELLMMVTNSLRLDLKHLNQFVVGLALSSLANVGSAGMARPASVWGPAPLATGAASKGSELWDWLCGM